MENDECLDEMTKVMFPDEQWQLFGNRQILDEVKKLRAHWDKTYSKEEGWMNELASKYYQEKDLENEALKEENEKLKEENERLEQYHQWNKSAVLQLNDAKAEIKKLKEENKKLQKKAKQVSEIKDFLKCCDRNTDGYYEHYETRQLAIRVEGELKSLVVAKSE